MATCEQCAAIAANRRDAPGHENLISLGDVRSLDEHRRGVSHEAFTCAICGAEWNYRRDKRDPACGWSRGEAAPLAPDDAARAA